AAGLRVAVHRRRGGNDLGLAGRRPRPGPGRPDRLVPRVPADLGTYPSRPGGQGEQAMNRTRWARYWDRQSARYDAEMMRWDKRLFGDSRSWACSQARGNVLEVAVGTGLNLPHYPPGVRLTGIDFSAQMLALAERRATGLGRPITLLRADAQRLPLADDSFDTVVC